MRILMTGSTGFTGKCLLPMLEDSGNEVWHLVRNKKGFKNEIVWDFVSPLPEGLPPCNIVIHLAAHVNFSQNLEVIQYNTNTVSTIQLAAYSRNHKAYFILASMVGVHGGQYAEIDKNTPINPENHYAVSKYISEEVIKANLQSYSILRICGIYGLDGPDHLGLNIAINNAIHKKMVPVLKGPGKAKRNYISVHDVARWVLNLVKNYQNMSNTVYSGVKEILYLASPEIMSIKEYLELIAETILGGMELEMLDGPESQDVIVKPSKTPFTPLTFRQYLSTLT